MLHPFRLDPFPALIAPQLAPRVSTRVDELEELRVGDWEYIDVERGDVHDVPTELVVPPEWDLCRVGAEHRQTRADGRGAAWHWPRGLRPKRSGGRGKRALRRRMLQLVAEPVPHIEQRLLVHRLVLERGVEPLDRLGSRGHAG